MIPPRIEVSPVIERRSHSGRKRIPQTVSCGRQELEGDRGVLSGQDVGHLLTVDGIPPLGKQVQRVTPLRKETDRRLKVAQKPEVGG